VSAAAASGRRLGARARARGRWARPPRGAAHRLEPTPLSLSPPLPLAPAGRWVVTLKRAGEFGTKKDCDTSIAAYNIREAFKAAQAAALKGDLPALIAARDKIQANLVTTFIQARRPPRRTAAVRGGRTRPRPRLRALRFAPGLGHPQP
jgi:hypothetical protein